MEEFEAKYTEYIQKWGKVERKGKNNPYTSHNGHMFSFIDKKEKYMAVRLDKQQQEAYFEATGTSYVIQYNSKMNGYICLTDEIFNDFNQVKDWLDKSFEFVCSLPPKASKK